jgi:hypothetical protein
MKVVTDLFDDMRDTNIRTRSVWWHCLEFERWEEFRDEWARPEAGGCDSISRGDAKNGWACCFWISHSDNDISKTEYDAITLSVSFEQLNLWIEQHVEYDVDTGRDEHQGLHDDLLYTEWTQIKFLTKQDATKWRLSISPSVKMVFDDFSRWLGPTNELIIY